MHIQFAQSRKTKVKEIEVGDIVIIESDKKRGSWKLGKIEKLITGKDNKVRAAEIKTEKKTLIKRHIQKLYPLEVPKSKPEVIQDILPVEVPAVPQPSARRTSEVFEDESPQSPSLPLATPPVPRQSRSGRQVKLPGHLKDYVFPK